MKLIIDIDEQHFELLQMAVMNGMGDNAQKIIAQGIPLEKIRDEIENITPKCQIRTGKTSIDTEMMIPQEKVLQIIDKYR